MASARRRHRDERQILICRTLESKRYFLTHRRAHAPAHEPKVQDDQYCAPTLDLSFARDDGFLHMRLTLRFFQKLGIRFLGGNRFRFARGELFLRLIKRFRIDDQVNALTRGNWKMMPASIAYADMTV